MHAAASVVRMQRGLDVHAFSHLGTHPLKKFDATLLLGGLGLEIDSVLPPRLMTLPTNCACSASMIANRAGPYRQVRHPGRHPYRQPPGGRLLEVATRPDATGRPPTPMAGHGTSRRPVPRRTHPYHLIPFPFHEEGERSIMSTSNHNPPHGPKRPHRLMTAALASIIVAGLLSSTAL